ncbi:MAG: hypothetical protein SCH39_00940 [Methanosarcinales archaeon]|nr:hypothetical protein [Methanosarcinales archaeon]
MEMKKSYIFLTFEGNTFQPDSESIEPDIENLQVIGISKGNDSHMAFENLIKENSYLLETSFDKIFTYELNPNFNGSADYYSLKSM